MNLAFAKRPVLRTRGRLFCNVTVSAGDCAAVAPTAGVRATTMATHQCGRTLEPVIEPGREAQPFAGSDRLGYVHAESTPIDSQPDVHEPVVEPGDVAGRHALRPVADEPRLSRVREDDDVEPLEPEEPGAAAPFLAILVLVLPGVVTPVEL